MGGISQNLKAVITFGGNLDNSWKRSADGLQKSLKDVGKQSERLTKDQTRLAAEIKRAKLAGESLGDLKRRYTDVSGNPQNGGGAAETECTDAKSTAHSGIQRSR